MDILKGTVGSRKNKQSLLKRKKRMRLRVFYLHAYSIKESTPNVWYVDSGCSSHMTGRLDLFTDLDESVTNRVTMGDGTAREAQGKGTVKLNSFGQNYIKNVLYVPDLDSNLLSVVQLLLEGYSIVFEDLTCYVFADKQKKHVLAEISIAKK